MKKTYLLAFLLPLMFIIPHAEGVSPNLYLTLATDKPVYNSTQPIAMALTILNTSNKPCKATFSSSFIYDFILYQDDQPVWKWSAGKMFAQAITMVEFLPNKPKTYLYILNPSAADAPKLAPGKYKLVGSLRTMKKTYLSEPVWIEVKE